MKHITKLLYALLIAASISWLMLFPIIWILRDGLGPDSVTSEGVKAVERFFMTFNYGPIGLALLLANLLVKSRMQATETKNGSLAFAMIGIFTVLILTAALGVFFADASRVPGTG